jgi:hypothetical protein
MPGMPQAFTFLNRDPASPGSQALNRLHPRSI